MQDLLVTTESGLECPAGGFFIDPWKPVDFAIVTHAHADHARPGSRRYLTTPEGEPVLRRRVQDGAIIETLAYSEQRSIGKVSVSLHPAGHVLGSAQVRIESDAGVWVVSGDYKLQADPVCTRFEPVPCDVFVTESTFGLPVFRWPEPAAVLIDLLEWWEANKRAGKASLVCAYALGKAQRLMAGLARIAGGSLPGPIGVHGAIERMNQAHVEAGVELPECVHAGKDNASTLKGEGLLIAPPSVLETTWLSKFGPTAVGMASGWMQMRGPRRRRNAERGFVLSDHADWPGLLHAIEQTGARRVLITHGYVEPMARYLREERGLDAAPLKTAFGGDDAEDPSHTTDENEASS